MMSKQSAQNRYVTEMTVISLFVFRLIFHVNKAEQLSFVFCSGNDNIHELTSGKNYELRIDLADFDGNTRYAVFSNFKVGSASEKYKLTSLGTYVHHSTAGMSMAVFVTSPLR